MSGPIVRKYGFPNFEKIFGERDLKHGTEEESSKSPSSEVAVEPAKTSENTESAKGNSGSSKD